MFDVSKQTEPPQTPLGTVSPLTSLNLRSKKIPKNRTKNKNMSDKLRKILPCINARQRILENFPDSDRELLTDFRTKFIILPKIIKVVKAITTSAGDQLFIATYKKKQRTKQVIIFILIIKI